MVRDAQRNGVPDTARLLEVFQPTVYKWKKRFDQEGIEGLKDRSHRPHHSPNALDKKKKQQIVHLRKRMPHCGAGRMIREFGIAASYWWTGSGDWCWLSPSSTTPGTSPP